MTQSKESHVAAKAALDDALEALSTASKNLSQNGSSKVTERLILARLVSDGVIDSRSVSLPRSALVKLISPPRPKPDTTAADAYWNGRPFLERERARLSGKLLEWHRHFRQSGNPADSEKVDDYRRQLAEVDSKIAALDREPVNA
jgi:hypothetical protein